MAYKNFKNQTIVFDDNKPKLVYRGRPSILVLQFYGATYYLGAPENLSYKFGLQMKAGTTIGFGAGDFNLDKEDYIELYARTPDPIPATDKPYINTFFLED